VWGRGLGGRGEAAARRRAERRSSGSPQEGVPYLMAGFRARRVGLPVGPGRVPWVPAACRCSAGTSPFCARARSTAFHTWNTP